MKITIIGTGLIGGSFALALRKTLPETTITGFDQNEGHLNQALQLGLIDQAAPNLETSIKKADWIFLSIPVHAISKTLNILLPLLQPHQTIVDFGSTKHDICKSADTQVNRSQFIAAHPIAGTEFSGPEAAVHGLFENKNMVICDAEKSNPDRVAAFESMCRGMRINIVHMPAHKHDQHLAYISHLSHVIAFGLSNTVLEKEKSDQALLALAGTGFASTARLAKSDPEMWTPIFMQNKNALLESLDGFMSQLNEFREKLKSNDREGLLTFLENGRKIRKVLGE